ncbi:hypothetical protein LXL04_018878 [Taraxacum kok-saghyz]
MAKLPVAGNTTTSDHLQTWILRVYIHCEGCKKKVFKVLQSIDGDNPLLLNSSSFLRVYKTEIDSLQRKAIVTGSVDGNTLVQKLLRAGKHAEVLPESFKPKAAADSAPGKSKKKKKKQKDAETTDADSLHVDEEKQESEVATTEGIDSAKEYESAEAAIAAVDGNGGGGGGGKKKKKKNKGDKKDNNAPADTESVPATADNLQASMEQLDLSRPGPPGPDMVYATPYNLPPNYYPAPAYGVSYNTSYPSAESSYYTPPVYGYAQSHPSGYYPRPLPPAYYPRSAFDDHDDDNGQGRSCNIM